MLSKTFLSLTGLLLLVIVGASIGTIVHRAPQTAQSHLSWGFVTEVTTANWNYEVEMAKDRQPVLVYFYSFSSSPAQRQIVQSFAQSNAGRIKVVAVNCDRPDAALLAQRYNVLSCPAFAAFYRLRQARGIDGIFAGSSDLQRLINRVALP